MKANVKNGNPASLEVQAYHFDLYRPVLRCEIKNIDDGVVKFNV